MGVPGASVVEKIKVLVAKIEQHSTLTGSIGRSASTVSIVPTIMVATGIVEDCEESNNLLHSATPGGDKQAIALDSPPMCWSVDRI